MTTKLKLLSAATGIAMALGVAGAQATEVLTADQLDNVNAGAAAAAAASGAVSGAFAAAIQFPTVSVNYPNGTQIVTVNPGAFAIANAWSVGP